MAENTFHLIIASVGETRFDSRAISVTLPGSAGEFTVLPHHEALVTTLKPGHISLKDQHGESMKFEIEGGVFECANNRAVVLL